MGGNSQRKISKRRKKSAELWDFYASKVLLAVKPDMLYNIGACLLAIGLPISKKSKERLRAALLRTGAVDKGFRYGGSMTGRWSDEFSSIPVGRWKTMTYSGKLSENLAQQAARITGIPHDMITLNEAAAMTATEVNMRQQAFASKFSAYGDIYDPESVSDGAS